MANTNAIFGVQSVSPYRLTDGLPLSTEPFKVVGTFNVSLTQEIIELFGGSNFDAFDIELGDEDEENDDIVDEVEYLISGFDELASFYLDTDFGDNGTKYTIINLGLDDDDDKVIIVERLYSIRYELKDSTDKLKADILVTGTITYDDDEFEADLVFSLV